MARKCRGLCALCGAEIQKLMKCGSVYGADCWWVKAVAEWGPDVAILQSGPPVSKEEAEWLRRHPPTVRESDG